MGAKETYLTMWKCIKINSRYELILTHVGFEEKKTSDG